MNPFSRALVDFYSGNLDAAFTIRRDDGFEQQVFAAPFFNVEHYPPLEIRAMGECYGNILDIGSATGRHSLELLRRGFKVTSLDILPEMEAIMKSRGLTDVVIADVFRFFGPRYDTLLMLMNGIGMTGSIDGLTRFLQLAHDLTVPGGQIVCDSIDVSVTTDPQHLAYRKNNLASGRLAGQQSFVMVYHGEDSVRFDWLHIDFQSFSDLCDSTDWNATLLEVEDDGHYLCKLIDKPTRSEQADAGNRRSART